MQLGQYRFLPRLWLSLLTLVLLITFIRLGIWQLDRADEKRQIQQQQQALFDKGEISLTQQWLTDNRPKSYQPVILQGNFDFAHSILIDNKIYNARSGYHVVTPFRLQNSDVTILVNRGWLAAGPDRSKLPQFDKDVEKNSDVVTIHGMVKYPSSEFKLGENNNNNNKWPWRIQWLDLQDIGKSLKHKIEPFIILQNKNDNEKFIRDWQIVVSPPEKNQSYAAQWFTMALVLLIVYIVTNTKKIRNEHE